MDNSVYAYGEVVGYRCIECGEIFPSMWGLTCNSCESKEKFRRRKLALDKERNQLLREQNELLKKQLEAKQ